MTHRMLEISERTTVVSSLNPTRSKILEHFGLHWRPVRGAGHFLFDDKGQAVLDFLSQYGAVSLGHNHPELVRVIRDLLESEMPCMVQPLPPVKAEELATRLAELTPGDLSCCTFGNSGAEVVEAAIKLARAHTGKRRILSTVNGFHGKTLGALSATGKKLYQEPFGAPFPDFDVIPFDDLQALQDDLEVNGERTAAFLVEPIQGEGGVILPEPGFLGGALALCRRFGVLLVVDEIQTGLGRTGSLFATGRNEPAPDVLLLGKALGGGLFPLGACITSSRVWNHDFGTLHSSTFANNNFACAVGIQVLNILCRDDRSLIRHVAQLGDYLLERLQELQARFPGVLRCVRGKGYLAALEFQPFSGDDSYTMGYFSHEGHLIPLIASYLLKVHRVLTAPVFNHEHVLRLEPPFTVGRGEIDRVVNALEVLCDALDRGDYYEIIRSLVDETPRSSMKLRRFSSKKKGCVRSRSVARKPQGRFAFLMHPTDDEDLQATDPSFRSFSESGFERWKEWVEKSDPGCAFHLEGLRSATGQEAEGWLIAVPLLPDRMLKTGRAKLRPLLEKALSCAASRGARIAGLGGFISIMSRGGIDIRNRGLPVTSGNSLTAVMTVEGIEDVVRRAGLRLQDLHVAVIGATGSVGAVVARMMAFRAAKLTLVGNPQAVDSRVRCSSVGTRVLRDALEGSGGKNGLRIAEPGSVVEHVREVFGSRGTQNDSDPMAVLSAHGSPSWFESSGQFGEQLVMGSGATAPIYYGVDLAQVLSRADVVVTAASSSRPMIRPQDLRAGAIVCDVGRPHNVDKSVLTERKDVFVFDGGLVQLPEHIGLGVGNFCLPPGVALGCLAECLLLALEQDYTDHSLGQQLSLEELGYFKDLAKKHGFQLPEPHAFGRRQSDEILEKSRREVLSGRT